MCILPRWMPTSVQGRGGGFCSPDALALCFIIIRGIPVLGLVGHRSALPKIWLRSTFAANSVGICWDRPRGVSARRPTLPVIRSSRVDPWHIRSVVRAQAREQHPGNPSPRLAGSAASASAPWNRCAEGRTPPRAPESPVLTASSRSLSPKLRYPLSFTRPPPRIRGDHSLTSHNNVRRIFRV